MHDSKACKMCAQRNKPCRVTMREIKCKYCVGRKSGCTRYSSFFEWRARTSMDTLPTFVALGGSSRFEYFLGDYLAQKAARHKRDNPTEVDDGPASEAEESPEKSQPAKKRKLTHNIVVQSPTNHTTIPPIKIPGRMNVSAIGVTYACIMFIESTNRQKVPSAQEGAPVPDTAIDHQSPRVGRESVASDSPPVPHAIPIHETAPEPDASAVGRTQSTIMQSYPIAQEQNKKSDIRDVSSDSGKRKLAPVRPNHSAEDESTQTSIKIGPPKVSDCVVLNLQYGTDPIDQGYAKRRILFSRAGASDFVGRRDSRRRRLLQTDRRPTRARKARHRPS